MTKQTNKKSTGVGKRNHSRKLLLNAMALSMVTGALVPGIVAELSGQQQFAEAAESELDKRLVSGGVNSILITNEGSLLSWGDNLYGQIGDGTTTKRTKPVQVKDLNNIVAVSVGFESSYALKADGTVWAWGRNNYGQLGDGSTIDRTTPVQVNGLENVKGIVADPTGHTVHVIGKDGSVWGWGRNSVGQIGDNTTTDKLNPVRINALDDVGQVFSHSGKIFVLKNNGDIWTWGSNLFGQLGIENDNNRIYKPTKVAVSNVNDLVMGLNHTLAIKSDGSVLAWGRNNEAQSGFLDGNIRGIEGLGKFEKLIAGTFHNMTLREGKIWAWGSNGAAGLKQQYQPVQFTDLNDVADITTSGGDGTAGADANYALKTDGTVWSWGGGTWGKLGNGTENNTENPTLITGMPKIVNIKSANRFAFALGEDGTLWAWGNGYNGRLGNGSENNQVRPVLVNGVHLDFSKQENIDKEPPVIVLTANTTGPTNKDVVVTASISDDGLIAEKKWAIGTQTAEFFATGGTTLTDSFAATANGVYTVYAKDTTGNETIQTITVTNIDKTPPNITSLDIAGNKLIVEATDFGSGIQKMEYSVDDSLWSTYVAGTTTIQSDFAKVDVRVTDLAGNVATAIHENTAVPDADSELFMSLIQEMSVMKSNILSTSFTKELATIHKARLAQISDEALLLEAEQKRQVLDKVDELLQLIAKVESIWQGIEEGKDMEDEINSLPESDLKDNVGDQNNQTQTDKEANSLQIATAAVVKAETTVLQTDVNAARTVVSALGNEENKLTLNARLDVVQALIDARNVQQEKEAKEAVDNAIKTGSQLDVDDAQIAVDKLPDGPTKDDLQGQLDKVQDAIDKQVALDKLIAEAIASVEKAESSVAQIDVNSARYKVGYLPAIELKNELTIRLDAVQALIQDRTTSEDLLTAATRAVEAAEKYPTQYNVTKAEETLLQLPEGLDKEGLRVRLDAVIKNMMLGEVETLVAKAERYRNSYNKDTYFGYAQEAVNFMPVMPEKQAFQSRLDVLRAEVEEIEHNTLLLTATKKVEQAERYERDPYLADAQELVSQLKPGADRLGLQERLNAITQKIKDKEDAESNTSFKDLFSKVTDANTRKQFQIVHNAITRAEKYSYVSGIRHANNRFNALPVAYNELYPEMMAHLQVRMDAVNEKATQGPVDDDRTPVQIQAETAVEKAEQYGTASRIRTAQSEIDTLEDGEFKTDLQKRLNLLKETGVDEMTKDEKDADTKVASAEKSPITTRFRPAQAAINKLPAGDFRDDLQERLDIAMGIIKKEE